MNAAPIVFARDDEQLLENCCNAWIPIRKKSIDPPHMIPIKLSVYESKFLSAFDEAAIRVWKSGLIRMNQINKEATSPTVHAGIIIVCVWQGIKNVDIPVIPSTNNMLKIKS